MTHKPYCENSKWYQRLLKIGFDAHEILETWHNKVNKYCVFLEFSGYFRMGRYHKETFWGETNILYLYPVGDSGCKTIYNCK